MKKRLRAHCFQHLPFEKPGSLERWFEEHGYLLTYTRFFESVNLPELGMVDFLIILGGTMSVNDEDQFPWLVAEKRFVRAAIESGIPVLGICLGAQMIASAMGARVFPNAEKEIGWFPIYAVETDDRSVFSLPARQTAFHWHSETFDLPPGAVRLAKSEGCEHQVFQLGDSVIGLQCHLEATPQTVKALLANIGVPLAPSKYVQSAREILAAGHECYQAMHQRMADILTFLHERSAGQDSHSRDHILQAG